MFHNLHKTTADKVKLKFRPTIYQTGTATHESTKVIGEYLKLLAYIEHKIKDCLKFPDILKQLLPLQRDEEYRLCENDSLFTSY